MNFNVNPNTGETSSRFKCECGQVSGWITESRETDPCPNCKKVYVGQYNRETGVVEARLVGVSQ